MKKSNKLTKSVVKSQGIYDRVRKIIEDARGNKENPEPNTASA